MKGITLFFLALLPVLAQAQCGTSGDTLFVESPEDLAALSDCTEILGSLLIDDPNFTEIDVLDGITSIEEHLILDGNISLQSLAGLSDLTFVGGNLELRSNFTLQSSAGLESLASIGGDFILDGNITLISLSGLSGLEEVTGDVYIGDNHTLEDISCFSGMTALNGDLILDFENFILNDLSGLSEVEEIQGDFYIELPGLTTMNGLSSLHTIGGDFTIQNIPLLGTLNGLEPMRVIGDSLKLKDNDSMVSINALAGLDEITGSAVIQDNNSLLLCCAFENWDLGNIVQGEWVLEENHPTCNDLAQVLENCEPLSISASAQNFIPGLYHIRVFSLSGRLLHQEHAALLNAEAIEDFHTQVPCIAIGIHDESGFVLHSKLGIKE